jgi:hypothetical protein
MKRSSIAVLFVGCLLSGSSSAAAQFDALGGLASGFSDLGIAWGPLFPIHSDVRPDRHPGSRSLAWYGAEFLFEIGKPVAGGKPSPKPTCKVLRDKATERRITYSAGKGDSTRVVDSIDVYSVNNDCPKPERQWQLEFGIGYSETSRFVISTPAGNISGLLRETPSVSVYANYFRVIGCDTLSTKKRLSRVACWDGYFGVHTGVTALVDPSLSSATLGPDFSGGSPKSVQIGGIGGVANDLFPVITIFSEVGYVYRPFPRISWSGTTTVPQGARTRLDLSSLLFGFGLQVRVKDPKKG